MIKFSAVVRDGNVVLLSPKTDLPEGKVLTLMYDDRCHYVFVPGVLNPPGSNKPRQRTRCSFSENHEGDHSWGSDKEILIAADDIDDG